MERETDNFNAIDADLTQVSHLLDAAGAADRTVATPERVDRIAAATAPMLAQHGHVEVTYKFPVAAAEHRSVARFPAMRIAAGLAIVFSLGAAVIALRSNSATTTTTAGPPVAVATDDTTDFELVDALFADSGSEDSTWSDADALHTRVSADLGSYWNTSWASDDFSDGAGAQNGESL
jgi:hypothetical protein